MSLSFLAFTGILLSVGALRIAELIVSKRRMVESDQSVVAEPWLFPLMATLHTGLIALPLLEVYVAGRPLLFSVALPALAVLAAATALRIWTLSSLGRAWNVRVVPPRPDQIVTTGPYAFIRHPNYLVVILEIAALPLLHSAYLSALGLTALNAFVLFHRIRTEEATLSGVPGWNEAMRDRKRLIPGIF
ncbi:MAG: hypothetical protein EA397_19060 [Deltaproteobacteria bacterium]|nr:MAG: hypothetical protein EA397_19060 [Deltaproteobacteria bacterium]